MHKISIINSKTLLVIIFIGIQPSTCLPEPQPHRSEKEVYMYR